MSLESEGKEMRGCVSLESGIFVADDGRRATTETRGVLRGPRGPKKGMRYQRRVSDIKYIRYQSKYVSSSED